MSGGVDAVRCPGLSGRADLCHRKQLVEGPSLSPTCIACMRTTAGLHTLLHACIVPHNYTGLRVFDLYHRHMCFARYGCTAGVRRQCVTAQRHDLTAVLRGPFTLLKLLCLNPKCPAHQNLNPAAYGGIAYLSSYMTGQQYSEAKSSDLSASATASFLHMASASGDGSSQSSST